MAHLRDQLEFVVANPDQLHEHYVGGLGMFRFMGKPYGQNAGCICFIKELSDHWAYIKGKPHEEFTKRIRNDEKLLDYDTLMGKWFNCKSDDERREILEPYVVAAEEYEALCGVSGCDITMRYRDFPE